MATVDGVEAYRRQRQAELNAEMAEREELEKKYGKVWNTQDLLEEFVSEGFLAPYVVVHRKDNGQRGTMEFQHHPRFYFNWQPEP